MLETFKELNKANPETNTITMGHFVCSKNSSRAGAAIFNRQISNNLGKIYNLKQLLLKTMKFKVKDSITVGFCIYINNCQTLSVD